ncbi:MAG: hypothetical protein JEZ00_15950 [Anaerolineaceae bacterium]|nr:hypothetical protein [Anaerolineaceae bacterium]
MNKGLIAIVSFFLTAIILIVGVSVVNATTALKAAKQPATVQEASISNEEVLIQQMNEREAAYQQLITEANTRIETLNNQLTANQSTAAEVQMVSLLAPDQAVNIALAAVEDDDALTQLPELVNYEGRQAYEVKMTNGVLYIDAETGVILFNNVPERINGEQAAEIVGVYLGGMDPRYAVVTKTILNGTEIYKVVFNNYTVFVDPYGEVVSAQVYRYISDDNNNDSTGSSSSSSSDDHDDDHDEHEEDDDDDD